MEIHSKLKAEEKRSHMPSFPKGITGTVIPHAVRDDGDGSVLLCLLVVLNVFVLR